MKPVEIDEIHFVIHVPLGPTVTTGKNFSDGLGRVLQEDRHVRIAGIVSVARFGDGYEHVLFTQKRGKGGMRLLKGYGHVLQASWAGQVQSGNDAQIHFCYVLAQIIGCKRLWGVS